MQTSNMRSRKKRTARIQPSQTNLNHHRNRITSDSSTPFHQQELPNINNGNRVTSSSSTSFHQQELPNINNGSSIPSSSTSFHQPELPNINYGSSIASTSFHQQELPNINNGSSIPSSSTSFHQQELPNINYGSSIASTSFHQQELPNINYGDRITSSSTSFHQQELPNINYGNSIASSSSTSSHQQELSNINYGNSIIFSSTSFNQQELPNINYGNSIISSSTSFHQQELPNINYGNRIITSSTSFHQQELPNVNNGVRNLDEFFNSFPPGYRFRPTEEELIVFYLLKKVHNQRLPPNLMAEVDIFQGNPEIVCRHYRSIGEQEWYFFSPRERRYPNGIRPRRSTQEGYWKVSGTDKRIYSKGRIIGRWNTLVFYEGKAPNGRRTNWIMREYRVEEPSREKTSARDMMLDNYVLCKVYKKVEKPGIGNTKETEMENLESGENSMMDPSNEDDQSLSIIPQLQNDIDDVVASTTSDDHTASNRLPSSEDDTTPDLSTFPEFESSGLMIEPCSYITPPHEDIASRITSSEMSQLCYNNNVASTMDRETNMVDPICFEPSSSSGFRNPSDQYLNQEDLFWNSLENLEYFEVDPLLDPIYYSDFDGYLGDKILYDNNTGNNTSSK